MDEPRYSDRKQLAELGHLGPLYEEAPAQFRTALAHVLDELQKSRGPWGYMAGSALVNHWRQHFALGENELLPTWLKFQEPSTDDLLDFVEILVEEATKTYVISGNEGAGWWDIEQRLNQLFARHRFGFRLDGGQVHRVGSPALDEYIIQPALQAVHRPGWEQAERSFREALHHQRGPADERDDALTAATAALEAAMRAAGLRGDRLSTLAKGLRNSGLVPGQLEGVPDALDTLLKRSGAVRDEFSDAHGNKPDAEAVPEELVDLAVYWTGAFINYLAAAVDRR